MSPTITNGELVVADMFAYSRGTPKRWDVVVFQSPPAAWPSSSVTPVWIQRIVAVPGETVSFTTGNITINGKPLSPPSHLTNINYVALDKLSLNTLGHTISSPFVVPADSYFVLGDNSTNVIDSRFWGELPRGNILGKVMGK
jgi:signal peptidase I